MQHHHTALSAIAIAALIVTVIGAQAQPFEIEQPTIAGGGGETAGGAFALRGVINPQAAGRLEAGAFTLTAGLFPLDRADSGCPADINNNGIADPGDFTAWIAAYNAGLPAADQNGNGVIEPGDFTAWVANYNAGCQ